MPRKPRTFKPLPRCQSENCEACVKHPSAGPTARWIMPVVVHGARNHVVCPTCGREVNLAEWHAHDCKAVSRDGAVYSRHYRPRPAPVSDVVEIMIDGAWQSYAPRGT